VRHGTFDAARPRGLQRKTGIRNKDGFFNPHPQSGDTDPIPGRPARPKPRYSMGSAG